MSHKIIAVRKATERGKPNEASPNLEEAASSNSEQGKTPPAAATESPVSHSESATATPTVDAPKRLLDYQRPRKVERPEAKPLIDLPEVTNSRGEVFNRGDKIAVRAPWGGAATAEIANLYQDDAGCAWASYVPNESRLDWTWEKGFIRATWLLKS